MLEEVVKQAKPLPPKTKMLILGGGFSGQHVAALVRKLGGQVLCSRRNSKSLGADFIFNSNSKSGPPDEVFDQVTHILSCIPPSENGEDPVLSNLEDKLKQMALEWVGYLSTTGVYGDSQGDWVKESDTPKPNQERSKRRLNCEKAWQASGLPIQILRLPGIYGPGRSAIESVINGKSKMIYKPEQVFSRIHIDDIAGATIHLINLAAEGKKPEIINIADDLPSTNIEVLRFAASLSGHDLPPIEQFETAAINMSPMALSFWQENRRVSNEMLCRDLRYSLVHPNYQSGLKDCYRKYS